MNTEDMLSEKSHIRSFLHDIIYMKCLEPGKSATQKTDLLVPEDGENRE